MINTESALWVWIFPLVVLGTVITSVVAELAFTPSLPTRMPTPTATQAQHEWLASGATTSPTDIIPIPPTPVPASKESPTITPTDTPTAMPPTKTLALVPTAEVTEQPSIKLPEQPPAKPSEQPLVPPPQQSPAAVVVYANGLNMRYGPGVVFDPPIGYLHEGDILDVTGRIASNEWVQVTDHASGKVGWVSASPKYVQINVDLNTVPIAKPPPAPAPTLLEPPDGTKVSMSTRLDLAWKWDGTLGENDYFQVEIWNKYNNFDRPIDVAWVKGSVYKYEAVEMAYHPDYRWRITVISGIPAGEKDWSIPENLAWEPSNQFELVSEESEIWTLFIEPPDHAPAPPPPDIGGDDDDDDDDGGSNNDEPGGGI